MSVARLAVPDLVSNSYFPAIAAIELGFFAQEGLDVTHELIFPNYRASDALRAGKIDFVAGPAHAVFLAFPEWEGAKLLAALAQGMYWLLVMRTDLAATPGDVNAVKGRTIGAAPLVDQGLKRLLIDAGLDLDRDGVRIVGVPGANEPGVSFGVAAAKALKDGKLDGFWANARGPRTRSAPASAKWSLTSGADWARRRLSTIRCRSWRRATTQSSAIRTWRRPACAPW